LVPEEGARPMMAPASTDRLWLRCAPTTDNKDSTMTTANPYAAPGAIDMGSSDLPSYQPTVFSFSGRIGRIRYLAYSAAWNLVMMLIAAGGGAIAVMGGAFAVLGIGIAVVAYIGLIAAGFAMAVRRLNDLNQSGWLSLLMLV